MTPNLSKTLYCSGVQCPKMLWLKKHCPELFDGSVMNQRVLDSGSEVGDLAMGLFGAYTEVPFGNLADMIHVTDDLIAAGEHVIAEASFACDGLFCSVDILKNLGCGYVELYEVKSTMSVQDHHFHDLAFQMFVLEELGYHVIRACLVHINSKYVRGCDLEIEKLFAIEDLTDTVRQMQAETCDTVRMLKTCILEPDEPAMALGMHCFSPYDCGFWKHCTEKLPVPNVFNVSGMLKKSMFKCYNQGLVSYEDLLEHVKLNPGQKMQVQYELEDPADHIEAGKIREFLDSLYYPLYFLDFESFAPAVPLYENSRPYGQIVFQYSLHYYERKGGPLLHKEYLAAPGTDPRRTLAEQLCRDIPLGACTLAYNMSFEKNRIKELSELCPDLADHLLDICENMHDLMVPFQRKQYYTKAMHGSYSIKYVLPALFPDDPSLDYHNLNGVHNGAEASAAFVSMQKMCSEELSSCRENLLKYCCLDTLAMVRIMEQLQDKATGMVVTE